MAVPLVAGIGVGAAKLLKLLKLGGAATKAAKAALAAKKAAAATQGAAKGVQMAGGLASKLNNFRKAAGYSNTELALNLIPDIAMNALYFDQIPGDFGDKMLAAGSNIALGQGTSMIGRRMIGAGKTMGQLGRIDDAVKKAATTGAKIDPRVLALRDKLQGRAGLAQGIEMAGMMGGGHFGYYAGEEAQKLKSYLSGQGYLSPTDRMFIEQDEAMQQELLAAYAAGQSSGARFGYDYDPYTGEVPLGGIYGY